MAAVVETGAPVPAGSCATAPVGGGLPRGAHVNAVRRGTHVMARELLTIPADQQVAAARRRAPSQRTTGERFMLRSIHAGDVSDSGAASLALPVSATGAASSPAATVDESVPVAANAGDHAEEGGAGSQRVPLPPPPVVRPNAHIPRTLSSRQRFRVRPRRCGRGQSLFWCSTGRRVANKGRRSLSFAAAGAAAAAALRGGGGSG